MSNVTINQQGTQLTVLINGRFDFNVLREFRQCYEEVAGSGIQFLVDMNHAEYMDSSALGMLLNMRNHLFQNGHSMEISNCKPNIKKIFTMAHFDKLFDFI